MNWIEAINHWRALSPELQRQICRQRLPHKVARSMAFEGEPVDLAMLEEFLANGCQIALLNAPAPSSPMAAPDPDCNHQSADSDD